MYSKDISVPKVPDYSFTDYSILASLIIKA